METIQSLRKKGYKVRVTHFRYGKLGPLPKITVDGQEYNNLYRNGKNSVVKNPFAKGGKTVIEVTEPFIPFPAESKTVKGEAICSLEDNFNRKIGNSIALGRALEQLKESVG